MPSALAWNCWPDLAQRAVQLGRQQQHGESRPASVSEPPIELDADRRRDHRGAEHRAQLEHEGRQEGDPQGRHRLDAVALADRRPASRPGRARAGRRAGSEARGRRRGSARSAATASASACASGRLRALADQDHEHDQDRHRHGQDHGGDRVDREHARPGSRPARPTRARAAAGSRRSRPRARRRPGRRPRPAHRVRSPEGRSPGEASSSRRARRRRRVRHHPCRAEPTGELEPGASRPRAPPPPRRARSARPAGVASETARVAERAITVASSTACARIRPAWTTPRPEATIRCVRAARLSRTSRRSTGAATSDDSRWLCARARRRCAGRSEPVLDHGDRRDRRHRSHRDRDGDGKPSTSMRCRRAQSGRRSTATTVITVRV